MTNSWKYLVVDVREGVPVITITREEKLNALNTEVFGEIQRAVEWLSEESDSNTIILTGSGRAFIAGADLGEYGDSSAENFEAFQRLGQKVYGALRDSNKIIVAALNGYALGGGLEMAIATDIVFASSYAKLGLPEVKLGLLPGGGGTVFLGDFLPPGVVKDIILTGRMLSADEAFRWGIVQKVSVAEELLGDAVDYCRGLNTLSPDALGEIKNALDPRRKTSIDEKLVVEREALMRLYHSDNGQEGIRAFLEKRDPTFRGQNR